MLPAGVYRVSALVVMAPLRALVPLALHVAPIGLMAAALAVMIGAAVWGARRETSSLRHLHSSSDDRRLDVSSLEDGFAASARDTAAIVSGTAVIIGRSAAIVGSTGVIE